MVAAHQSQEKAYQKYAWVILFGLGILLVLNILIGAFYGGFTLVAVTGLLLPIRKFFPK